jgi:type IV pilus assembly protein PilQ
VVLDFPATRNGLSSRQQPINKGVAEQVSVLEGDDRTRATVSLARMIPYKVRTEGNTVLLTLEAGATRAVTTAAVTPPQPLVQTSQSLKSVDFRRGISGEGIVNIKLSNPSITANVRDEGSQIVIDFLGTNLPRSQERRLDVIDFATPVTQVDAVNQGNNARITVRPIPPYEYLAYQVDDNYTIEVKPAQKEKPDAADSQKKVYTGQLLSLNFQDIEVRAVLQLLSDFTGQNIVVSDTVEGNLTLRLQNVPWDQALDIILRTKGLTMRQNGNVIYIAPTEEVAAREKLELEARKTVTELVPLRSELIQINYAKAQDLGELLKTKSQQKEASLLSPRGQVTVDERTNTILVQDIPEKITEIRGLIARLDIPVRQVMIDSRVVIANDDFSKELGIRWGGAVVAKNGDNGIVTATGAARGTNTTVIGTRDPTEIGPLPGSAARNARTTGQPFPVPIPALADRLGVNLGTVTPPFGSLALAILGSDYLVDLELSALQAEGRGEVLSNPRVITTDRNEATIKQGREIPYQVVDQLGTPQIQFRDAVLELKVIPQITPDGRIIMDLRVKKDEQGPDVNTATGGSQPSINKREVATQVLVDNGETVVLGGVFEQITQNSIDKVPFLGDIPAIGRLFRRDANKNNKLELLVFVTPQIITGSTNITTR